MQSRSFAVDDSSPRTFTDRAHAGRQLAGALKRLRLPASAIVLGLPRGGVPVAYEVARVLQLPLDVLVVRKIGMPGNSEYAIGAVASGGVVVRDPAFARASRIASKQFDELVQAEHAEVERRERRYRGNRDALQLAGRSVLLIDDGLATGATMIAAVRAVRRAGARRVIAAAPVAASTAAARVDSEADETLFLKVPADLNCVGAWYDDFGQVEDEQVCTLLASAEAHESP